MGRMVETRRAGGQRPHHEPRRPGAKSPQSQLGRGTAPNGLSARILALLGESPLPVYTPDLVSLAVKDPGTPHQREIRVWSALRNLEKYGIVRREGTRRKCAGRAGAVGWVLTSRPARADETDPGAVRCLGPGEPDHQFHSPDRRRVRVCDACKRLLDALSPRSEERRVHAH